MNVNQCFFHKIKGSLVAIMVCAALPPPAGAELSSPAYYAHSVSCQTIIPPSPSIDINGITILPNRFIPIGGGTLVAIDAGNDGLIDELCVFANNIGKMIEFDYKFPADYVSGGATSGTVTITDAELTTGDNGRKGSRGNGGGNNNGGGTGGGGCGSTGCNPT